MAQARAAIVTGGGRGIGRAIGLALAEEGRSVAVADLLADEAHAVAAGGVTAGGGGGGCAGGGGGVGGGGGAPRWRGGAAGSRLGFGSPRGLTRWGRRSSRL